MNISNVNGFTLHDLGTINVVLGKNGCGKSYLLKKIEEGLKGNGDTFGELRYISPERGGLLNYEPSVEHSIASNEKWLTDQRRRNQSNNFRQQSAALFRRLETLVLRHIEKEHTKEGYVPVDFNETVERINTLLERVRLERDDKKAFAIRVRETEQVADPEQISSGESELISLEPIQLNPGHSLMRRSSLRTRLV